MADITGTPRELPPVPPVGDADPAVSSTAKTLALEYAEALRDYLAGRGEDALRRAYEAGRRALAEGMGVLEMVAAHQQALIDSLHHQPNTQTWEQALTQALSCLAESLSPFEMVLRGIQEANANLRYGLTNLQRAEEMLRDQNDRLTAAHRAAAKEHERYQALFDSAPDGYLVTDLSGVIQEANTAAAILLNTPKEFLSGSALVEFVSAPDREAFAEQLRSFHLGAVERREEWHVTIEPRQSRPIPTALTVVAERIGSAVAGLRWLIRDVSERKRLEQERARSLLSHARARAARRFQFLAEASSLLAGSLDVETSLASVAQLTVPYLAQWCLMVIEEPAGSAKQLKIACANPSSADLVDQLQRYCLFRKPGQGQSLETLVGGPRIVEEVTETWCTSVAEGPEHAQILGAFEGRAAMVVPLMIHSGVAGALVLLAGPSRRRYRRSDLVLAEDLAHRCALALENTRLYREITAERDKAANASRAKDEFLAILSHEMRNPLTPVIGWIRILKTHGLVSRDPTLVEGVASMERNANNLGRLVDDCLDLARVSEGKIQMERKPVDLNQITLASAEAIGELAATKRLRLLLDLAPEPLPVFGDATRLEQVVMNLMVNAAKYTGTGGRVSIRSFSVDGEAALELKDTGIGIDPDYLSQIFEPFRRGTSSWLTAPSGLGLGLSIARQIVELHAGRIWAESDGLHKGSSFHLRLPLAAGTLAGTEEPREIRPVNPDPGIRILLIEDSEDILFLMKIELERMGHTVLAAGDGLAGLEAARANLPDLIISDVKMPGLDGYELIRHIRATPKLRSTPAIALTGFGAKADVDRAVAAGFDACVAKPSEPAEIAGLIQKLTGTKGGTGRPTV